MTVDSERRLSARIQRKETLLGPTPWKFHKIGLKYVLLSLFSDESRKHGEIHGTHRKHTCTWHFLSYVKVKISKTHVFKRIHQFSKY